MTVTVTSKGSAVQFASEGVSVNLNPDDLGLQQPKSRDEALYMFSQLVLTGRLMVLTYAARVGQFGADKIPEMIAPFVKDVEDARRRLTEGRR